MSKKRNKSYIFKLAAILFAICFISTLLLTLCNYITKDRILQLKNQTATQAMQEVIPNAEFTDVNTEDFDQETKEMLEKNNFVEASKAEIDGKFAGYTITVSPQGFGDKINMIVGIKPDGQSYYAIKIVSLAETPGLGAKAQEKDFYGQFSDGKKGLLKVVKNSSGPSENEINAISGATITSEAVTLGANNAMEIVKILLEKEAA
ncbi:MAG: RnfABCDGE type electron transport complex subunit G [Clostridia bacterium]|nr:RnfABCDGE type electron transport complex subunit G [Clostridia bacterium]